jgi:tripartite-type tricarboxylate transporter receptor subunit TctC
MKAGRYLGIAILTVILALSTTGETLAAEKFPTKPITVVIGFPPGDTDNILRPFIEKMSEYLKQPMVYVYKPGASGTVGAALVASAKPDG